MNLIKYGKILPILKTKIAQLYIYIYIRKQKHYNNYYNFININIFKKSYNFYYLFS